MGSFDMNDYKEGFVCYEIAKKLKEKGFDEICYNYYEPLKHSINQIKTPWTNKNGESFGVITAPTIHQVLKWLRKEKGLFVAINIGYCYETNEIPFPNNTKIEPILKGYYYGIWELDNLNDKNGHSEYFETPELAAIAGIKYVLDNLI